MVDMVWGSIMPRLLITNVKAIRHYMSSFEYRAYTEFTQHNNTITVRLL